MTTTGFPYQEFTAEQWDKAIQAVLDGAAVVYPTGAVRVVSANGRQGYLVMTDLRTCSCPWGFHHPERRCYHALVAWVATVGTEGLLEALREAKEVAT